MPTTIPKNDAIEKNENPLDLLSLEIISPINEKMLGTRAPYPIPVPIVRKKKPIYPVKPIGIKIVNIEKSEKVKAPMHTIPFRTILSAKYPKISIKTPVARVNENVSTPNWVVSPPKPKYNEMVIKLGDIIFETDDISVTIMIKRIKDTKGRLFELVFI